MVVADDITFALMEREAIPLLICADVVRGGLRVLITIDDLATALETFAHHDVARLAVAVVNYARTLMRSPCLLYTSRCV